MQIFDGLEIPLTMDKEIIEDPQVIELKPNGRMEQTHCYQNVNTFSALVSKLNADKGRIDSRQLKAFSQWRLDYPLPNESFYPEKVLENLLSVVEKILLRGEITFSSPGVEQLASSIYGVGSDDDIENLIGFFNDVHKHPRSVFWESVLKVRRKNIFIQNV